MLPASSTGNPCDRIALEGELASISISFTLLLPVSGRRCSEHFHSQGRLPTREEQQAIRKLVANFDVE